MARLPRVVAVEVPHHVTQRGNARQTVFAHAADRFTYLGLGAGPSFSPLSYDEVAPPSAVFGGWVPAHMKPPP